MPRKNSKDRGIFQRPKGSGVWWTRVFSNGRDVRIKVGSKTAALNYYKTQKAAQIEGRLFPQKKKPVLFEEIAQARITYADAHHRRRGDDDARLRRWTEAFKGQKASSITPGMIEHVMLEMIKEGYEPATVNRYLVSLKATFSRAVRDKKLEANPASEVKALPTNNELVRYLSPAQEATLLNSLPERFRAIVTVAINTGIRQGELLRLNWADVDEVAGIITVQRSKHGKAHRVPMNSNVQAILSVIDSKEANEKVFKHNARYLRRVFDHAVKDVKLAPFRFHDLRHTFASRLAMQGANDRTIMELGGWKSPRMLNRYAHLSPRHLWEAVEGLTSFKPKEVRNEPAPNPAPVKEETS